MVSMSENNNDEHGGSSKSTTANSTDVDDELLGDRELRETEPSSPLEVESEGKAVDDRPLPLTLITQTKNHRELLDYFLTADIPDEGYNKSTIADQSGVSANGIRRHIDVFLAFGIVEETTDEGARITRYTTNPDNDVHRMLRLANDTLANNFTDGEIDE